MYKLLLIGLVATLVGCGTSNRVLAGNWINELLNPSPAGVLTGILQLSKPKPTETIRHNHGKSIKQIYQQEHQNHKYHDAQVDLILSQFPQRAYDVLVDPVRLSVRNRQVMADIGFVVRWNQSYLRQLDTTLRNASDSRGATHWATLYTEEHWGAGHSSFQFDTVRGQKVLFGLVRPGPQLMVTIGSRRLGCWDIPELSGRTQSNRQAKRKMVHPMGNGVKINGWLELRSRISLVVSPEDADNIGQARISVVNIRQCK
jgi:hypothetical protein